MSHLAGRGVGGRDMGGLPSGQGGRTGQVGVLPREQRRQRAGRRSEGGP